MFLGAMEALVVDHAGVSLSSSGDRCAELEAGMRDILKGIFDIAKSLGASPSMSP